MATHKNINRRQRNRKKRILLTKARFRPARLSTTRSWPGTKSLLPDWWPCLCNGGWDPCPVCGCGIGDEPPCTLCSPGPEAGNTAFFQAWAAHDEKAAAA